MPKHKFKILLGFLLSFILITVLFTKNSQADAANHVVISEIQVGGATATDEFVELYNPTNSDVSLSGWRLSKKISSGTLSNLVTTIAGNIPSHGHFLITHPTGYTGSTTHDAIYSTTSSITSDNTVILYDDAGHTVVDKVGMGTAIDFEGTATVVPANGTSIERSSPGQDTDNNLNDFVLKDVSDPHNSSFVEATPTPTSTPSPTPTETPTLAPTPTPNSSPTPSDIPTPIPTETPTPIPTESPTSLPTESPTPSSSPTGLPTPSPTSTNIPLGWLKSPVFTCLNSHIPSFVYFLLKLLIPWKFHCG